MIPSVHDVTEARPSFATLVVMGDHAAETLPGSTALNIRRSHDASLAGMRYRQTRQESLP